MSLNPLQLKLLGTWTLENKVQADLGYYKAHAFLIMHLMIDPLRIYQCKLPGCQERNNQVCQQGECLDMSQTVMQWSDVSAFFQFGLEMEDGVVWRSRIQQNTSGWLGPYNLVIPQNNFTVHSRYVTTVATDYLQPPVNFSMAPTTEFDLYAGASAVRASIARQIELQPAEDPYEQNQGTKKDGSCKNGDLQPILPRLQISKSRFQLDFPMLSLPDSKKDPLYKLWPSLQKHLPDFPIVGPYCFDDDPKRAYAVNVSYDSTLNNTWRLTQGCVENLPCWPNEHAKNHSIPNNGGGSTDVDLNKALLTYGCYFLLLVAVVSLAFNVQLSSQLKKARARHESSATNSGSSSARRNVRPATRSAAPRPAPRNHLEEPLLPQTTEDVQDATDEPAEEPQTPPESTSPSDNA